MALIPCKECGKQVSDQAVTCPQCGFDVQKDQDKIIHAISSIIAVIIFAGLLWWSWQAVGGFAESVVDQINMEWHERDNSGPAYTRVQSYVRRQENRFITEWPGFSERLNHVSKHNHTYTINSWYVADNRDGRFTRVEFSATITQLNEQEWEITDLTIR